MQKIKLKGALIFKISNYLTFTTQPALLNYCFVGQEAHEIGMMLQSKKEQTKGKVSVDLIETHAGVNTNNCHILYVSADYKLHEKKLDSISESIFTISTSSKLLKSGYLASIEFKNDKTVLSVSKDNLKKSKIRLEQRFLRLVQLI